MGNLDEILDVKCLSAEGCDQIAVATNSENLKVYDRSFWGACHVMTGHTDVILCLDTNPTNEIIATGSKVIMRKC